VVLVDHIGLLEVVWNRNAVVIAQCEGPGIVGPFGDAPHTIAYQPVDRRKETKTVAVAVAYLRNSYRFSSRRGFARRIDFNLAIAPSGVKSIELSK